MKKLAKFTWIFLILTFLSACNAINRMSTPVGGLPEATEPGAIPTLSEPLSAQTEATLQIFPLRLGSTWIYTYLGYDHEIEVIWRVVESVIDVQMVDGFYVATLERSAELLEGDPPQDFISMPETGVFYYLVDGSEIYQVESPSDVDLENAWLELIIPFPESGNVWYPNPELRALDEPGRNGSRTASEPYQQELTITGEMYTFYNIDTEVDTIVYEGTFCEGVGFVYREYISFDPVYGYRSELEGFSIQ